MRDELDNRLEWPEDRQRTSCASRALSIIQSRHGPLAEPSKAAVRASSGGRSDRALHTLAPLLRSVQLGQQRSHCLLLSFASPVPPGTLNVQLHAIALPCQQPWCKSCGSEPNRASILRSRASRLRGPPGAQAASHRRLVRWEGGWL